MRIIIFPQIRKNVISPNNNTLKDIIKKTKEIDMSTVSIPFYFILFSARLCRDSLYLAY